MVKGKDYFYSYISRNIIPIHRVAELSQSTEIKRKPTLEELLSTIINRDEVEKLIKQPVRKIDYFPSFKSRFLYPIGSSFFR
jgi:hypothetical protein